MNVFTFAFALVAVVAFAVAALSLTYAVKCISRCRAIQASWENSKPAKLAVEVGALSDALEQSRRQSRAEFGGIWARRPPGPKQPRAAAETPLEDGDFDEVDPEFAATLALQRAAPAK